MQCLVTFVLLTQLVFITAKDLLSSVNSHFSLETDTPVGNTGTFVFYISVSENLVLVQNTARFQVEITGPNMKQSCSCFENDTIKGATRIYKVVYAFFFDLEVAGTYRVYTYPVVGIVPLKYLSLSLEIQVSYASRDLCDDVGRGFISFVAMNPFPNFRYPIKIQMQYIMITMQEHKCQPWKARKPKWTIEKILWPSDTWKNIGEKRCLNPFLKRKVDIKEYTSKLLWLPLPGIGRESEFIIPAYGIPPGLYRICNTLTKGSVSVTHCGLVGILGYNHCPGPAAAMRIRITPEPEEFTWPLEDLTLNVTEYYNIYAFSGAVEAGEVKYRWTCSGHVICQSLRQNQTVQTPGSNAVDDIELPDAGTTLHISKDFITDSAQITLVFTLIYEDMLSPELKCVETAVRKITFISLIPAGVCIRCLLNCWYYVDSEAPLLVSLGCVDKEFSKADKPQIAWSVSNLTNPAFKGGNSYYFVVTDYGSSTQDSTAFYVRVRAVVKFNMPISSSVNVTDVKGQTREIALGKKFIIIRKLVFPVMIDAFRMKETQESVEAKPGELMSYLPRYSLDYTIIFTNIQLLVASPVIFTFRRLHEKGEETPEPNVFDDLLDDDKAKLSYIKDYVITRSLWSASDICIESSREADSGVSFVKITPTTATKEVIVITPEYALPGKIPVLGASTPLRKLWDYVRSENVFTVNVTLQSRIIKNMFWNQRAAARVNDDTDQTFLGPLSRAIESAFIYKRRNKDGSASLNIGEIKSNSSLQDLTAQKEEGMTINNVEDEGVALNNVEDEGVKLNKVKHEGVTLNNVASLVESILDFMISGGSEYPMTYSNINLYLVALIRMLTIPKCDLVILSKALQLLEKAHDFHETFYDNPANEEELTRLKLEAFYAITEYFVDFKKEQPNHPEITKYFTMIVANMSELLFAIADRQAQMYPDKTTFATNRFRVEAFWLDPFSWHNTAIMDFGKVQLHFDINGLRNVEFYSGVNTFINFVAYVSVEPFTPTAGLGMLMTAPTVHVGVQMKEPIMQPFFPSAPGMYDIRFFFNFTDGSSEKRLKLGIYSKKENHSKIAESNCYFFRGKELGMLAHLTFYPLSHNFHSVPDILQIEASIKYATMLTITPASDLKLGIKIHLTNELSSGLKIIEQEDIILSKTGEHSARCPGVKEMPYSVFLPPLTMRQNNEFRGSAHYYMILKVMKDQAYVPQNVSAAPYGYMAIGQESVSIKCMKLMCARLEETKLTIRDCYVDSCSGGEPSFISCKCSTGRMFTAGAESCASEKFDISSESLRFKDMETDEDVNLMIPVFIISVWMIYFALLKIAYLHDKLERPMGKTYALEGVFEPIGRDQYLMCFVTGFMRGCGTKSIPYMTIIGTQKISPRYKLLTPEKTFVNGSEIWLLVSVPTDLGKPRRVILSIESEFNKLSSWFVQEVYIKHIKSGEEWVCSFNSWIPTSTHHSHFDVSDALKKQSSARSKFPQLLLRLLRNQHPIFGISSNIPGSYYTKAQHVTFCFCGLNIIMWVCFLMHDLPTPKLAIDPVYLEKFSLDVEFYLRGGTAALITVLPIYFLGLLLELAEPLDTRNVEHHQHIKQPNEISLPIKRLSNSPPASFMESIASTTISFKTNRSHPVDPSIVDVKMEDTHEDTQVTSLSKVKQFQFKLSRIKSNDPISAKVLTCLSLVFPLPVSILLLLMCEIMVSISYYIFVLGMYFSTASSMKYLYIVGVAYLVFVALLFPLVLFVVAVVNVMLYSNGKSYYGKGSESVSRIKSISAAMPYILTVEKLNITERSEESRDKNIRPLSTRTVKRSHDWCKQRMLKKKALKRKQVRYNNKETIIFILIVLLIINIQVGNVRECFLQTSFLNQVLQIGKVTDEPAKALTIDSFWEDIINKFYSLQSLQKEYSTVFITTLSAVRLRQVRAQPYKGNCTKDYPDLIYPHCVFNVEDSKIEMNNFKDSWANPTQRSILPGPYTYTKGQISTKIITAKHYYPAGGYDTFFSPSNTNPDTLLYLKKNNWIDENTRAVILSINLINSDSALSTCIEHVYEFTLTGIFAYTSDMYTFPLLIILSSAGIFAYTSDMYTYPLKLSQLIELLMSCLIVVLALMTTYFLLYEIKACFELGLVQYFKFGQSWFLLLERILSIVVLQTYMWLQKAKAQKLLVVQNLFMDERERTIFVSFDTVAETTYNLLLISSSLVIVCFLKIILRFREHVLLGTFVNMIPIAVKETILPITVTICFASLGCLLFQPLLENFITFSHAAITVNLLMMESSALVPTADSIYVIGRVYIISLYCVMLYIILNYFIVLLNEAYSEQKQKRKKV